MKQDCTHEQHEDIYQRHIIPMIDVTVPPDDPDQLYFSDDFVFGTPRIMAVRKCKICGYMWTVEYLLDEQPPAMPRSIFDLGDIPEGCIA